MHFTKGVKRKGGGLEGNPCYLKPDVAMRECGPYIDKEKPEILTFT